MSKITDALAKLDPANPNHWTDDGLPRMDTVKILSGDPSLTREQVTTAAPEFNREAALAALQGASPAAATPAPAATDAAPAAPVQAAPVADAAPSPPTPDLPNLEPTPLAEVSNDQLTLENQITEAKLDLSDALNEVTLAKERVEQAQNTVADLEAKLVENGGGPQNVIGDYLSRQRANLEDRAARKYLIKDSGLDLKQLAKDLKSPIDAAMERKTGRGGRRPVRS